jgi:hypothetical protein
MIMKDFFEAIKDDFKAVLQTRLAWLLGGLFGSGQDVPSIFGSLKGFFGF